MTISEYTSQMFILLRAFMFQGPAGTKGDKGERVSHFAQTFLPHFRANQVSLL